MAEVRKRIVEDKYNTSKIKTKETKKEEKKVEPTKSKKKEKKDKKKKGLIERFIIFLNGVKGEIHKVHWTSKQDMVKYSIATILFIVFMSLFFYLIDILFALVQSLFI